MNKLKLGKQESRQTTLNNITQQQPDWQRYQTSNLQIKNSNTSNNHQLDNKKTTDFLTTSGIEPQSRELGRAMISAISHVSDASDDGFKCRYYKALKELNNVLEANKQLSKQIEQLKRQTNFEQSNHQPQKFLIHKQMQQLRIINQKLQEKIQQILLSNQEYKQQLENMHRQRQNLNKQIEKYRHLDWTLQNEKSQINSFKDQRQRQVQSLKNVISRLESANMTLKNQEICLEDMYNQKEQSNQKKICCLQSQLEQAKSQLIKQRQKTRSEVQNMSIKIRKQSQQELFNYKTQIAKLKNENREYQNENQKLKKDLKDAFLRKTDKKNHEQKHIIALQENIENCKKQIRFLKNNLTISHTNQIERDSLLKEIKMLQNNLQVATQQTSHLRVKTNSLLYQNKELVSKNANFQHQLQKLRVNNQKLCTDLKKKDSILRRHKAQSDTLKSTVVKLQIQQDKDEYTGGTQNNCQGRWDESYKQKYEILSSKLKLIADENKMLIFKIEKYQNFVPKLEHELQKAITQSQCYEQSRSHQFLKPSQNLLQNKIQEMNDRFIIASKYAKQELQTKCLEYDSKLVSCKLQISKLKEALKGESFFHIRITEFSQKLSDAQDKKLNLIQKICQLQKELQISQRSCSCWQQQLQDKKLQIATRQKENQQLKNILIQRDKQITKLRAQSKKMNCSPDLAQFQNQKRQLMLKISELLSQKEIVQRTKSQNQQRNWLLQNQISKFKSNNQSIADIRNIDSQDPSFFEDVHKLRQQNVMLRQYEKSYFRLQQKSSSLIQSFQEFKLKYEATLKENVKLKQQNRYYKQKEIQHQAKTNNSQQMFDAVYKRLQQTLYQNSELLSKIKQLKGQVGKQAPQSNFNRLHLVKTMSMQSPSKFRGRQLSFENSKAPKTKVIENKQRRKGYEVALFARDSDSYSKQFSDQRYFDY